LPYSCLQFALSTLGIAIKGATGFSSPKGKGENFLQVCVSWFLAGHNKTQKSGKIEGKDP
jgi:hypothetical protein